MDIKSKKIAVAILSLIAIVIVIAIAIHSTQDDDEKYDGANKNVLSRGYFDLAYEPQGTHTEGSYFIIEDGTDLRMKIIAKVTVGPEDFGGISFNFIRGFEMTEVTCDFGDGRISDHVSYWWTASLHGEITSYVEIENSIGTEPIGGGTGMVEIELEIDQGRNMKEPYFVIGAGSRISGSGTVIINPATEKIFVDVSCDS